MEINSQSETENWFHKLTFNMQEYIKFFHIRVTFMKFPERFTRMQPQQKRTVHLVWSDKAAVAAAIEVKIIR